MTIRIFSFPEIQSATNFFDDNLVLWRGAFGEVYKGSVERGVIDDDTTTVAISRLDKWLPLRCREFRMEVTMLSKFRHCNIVSLLGYCDFFDHNDRRELILVYEFMPGGTVANHLYRRSNRSNPPPPLSWVQRLNICIGAGTGLNYLHTGTDLVHGVIHGDVKSWNILLNENLAAEVSGKGLSKLTPLDQSFYVGNTTKGTLGYMDPEYYWTGKLTRKSDVYSFGVVLLEMLCGRAAVDMELPQGQELLTKWAKPFMEITDAEINTDNAFRQIIDRSIVNEIKWGCLEVYVNLVNQCLHEDPNERPSMLDVVAGLQYALSRQEVNNTGAGGAAPQSRPPLATMMVGFEDGIVKDEMIVGFEDGSVKDEMIVGFEDVVMDLVDRLTGPLNHLELISIVGMPGLGKTTLAKQVYNHPAVVYHFHVRAWTRVSQAFQKRDLLLGILSSVVELTSDIYEMSDGKLLELLKKRLLGHRYLIVMDDMWDNGAWDDLRRSFPDNKQGSKIMFTSRVTELALQAQPKSHSCYLRFLTRSESWELLCQKVFQRKHCPPQLMEIGMQIAEKCKGLPLAIVVIAGILANEKTLTRWTEVAKSVSSYIVGNPEQYMDTIALSYNHLPRHLKTCFLYFGAFLEEHEIPVQKLIWLWVAEGFIRQSGCKRVEDVAADYFMDLINRSLIMVSKKGSNGGIKSCIMHDLLRELCLRKVKEENFMQRLFKYDDDSSSSNPSTEKPGRLCIYSAAFHHSSLMPFAPNATSLLCFAVDALPDFTSSICQAFIFLRVLDLSSIKIPLFPREIIQLVELRYIALHAEVARPPSSISNLQYLETFIISSRTNVTLPRSTWKMVNLRHIYIKRRENEIERPSIEEVQGKDGYPLIFENLQTLSYLCPSRSCEDVLARAPHLRKLGLFGRLISESRDLKFPKLDSSNHLETLKLFNTAFYPVASSSCNPIMFPDRLKRLTLTNTALAWSEMWTLGMLPNLEVLKLKLHACMGPRWETNDGGFLRLKFLKFQDLKIVQWISSSDHFPCLQHLVLHGCRELREIPFSLGDIPTLETIEVRWCSETAANSAREIKKDQEDKGNDSLKIILQEYEMM